MISVCKSPVTKLFDKKNNICFEFRLKTHINKLKSSVI